MSKYNRLTYRDEKGKAWAKLKTTCTTEEEMKFGRRSLEILTQYEESGLSPAEVIELTKEKEKREMNELSTKNLFTKLQDRLIINLQDNEILCPKCKGLRFILVEEENYSHIDSCRDCYNGKLYICKYCGKANRTDCCDCKEAREERNNNYLQEQKENNSRAYQLAEKINYKNYNDRFILPNSDRVIDIEELAEWIGELLLNKEDVPEYLWALDNERYFFIDLKTIIYDNCGDGYEYMYEHLNIKSPLLTQAQKLINQWQDEQGESLYIFSEDHKRAVVIKDLVDEISECLN